jgi:dTDP-4-dehydrorhamnose 3,5-epimerase
MKVTPTEIPEVLIVDPQVHRDPRGFFVETYHEERYADAGIRGPFVQDNHSCSERGILRGLHLQTERPQGKLLRVLTGEIFDVAVDVRVGSPTFARWVGVSLTGEGFRQLWVPPGFAHGFCVVSERAEVEYKCTDLYHPQSELTVMWNDPQIGIEWRVENPQLSAKDQAGVSLDEAMERLPRFGS